MIHVTVYIVQWEVMPRQILCDSCKSIVGGAVCIIVCSYIQRLIHMYIH